MSNSFSNRFSKGVNNLFSPTLTNFLIALSLIIILILTYISTNRLDLFADPNDIPLPTPTVDIHIISNMLNNYKAQIIQQSEFAKVLATQQANIDSYGKKFTNILNSLD
jgi:hypothetical protein